MRQPNGQLLRQFKLLNQRFAHVRLQPERGRVFEFEEWFARRGLIACVRELARDDARKRGGDLQVAEHRPGFGHGGGGGARAGLRGVEFLPGDGTLIDEAGEAFQIPRGLGFLGDGLVEPGLDLDGLEPREQLTGPHQLSGGHPQLRDPPGHAGFDAGALFRTNRTDDLLGDRFARGPRRGHAHFHRWQLRRNRLWLGPRSATREERGGQQQGGDSRSRCRPNDW